MYPPKIIEQDFIYCRQTLWFLFQKNMFICFNAANTYFFQTKPTHLLYVSLIGVYVDRRSWTYRSFFLMSIF